MPNSSRKPKRDALSIFRGDPAYRNVLLAMDSRKAMVEAMGKHARGMRLDVTDEFVDRHYDWFFRYHTGVIGRNQLINRTGAKLREFGVN